MVLLDNGSTAKQACASMCDCFVYLFTLPIRGASLSFQILTIGYGNEMSEGGMVVFDCCPFKYAPLVKRPPSCTQRVVLLFDVIVRTNRHVAPLLRSRPGVCH